MRNLDDEMLNWMKIHSGEDTTKLLLRYGKLEGIKQAVTQIESRRKYGKKIPSFVENEKFLFPHSLSGEQCTMESISTFHSSLLDKECQVLDMTGGLGIDAMTIAKSCDVTVIEKNQEAAYALKHNGKQLGLNNFKVIEGDSIDWLLENEEAKFDYIFIDPARRNKQGGRLRNLKECEPDVCGILTLLLEHSPIVIIKASPMLDMHLTRNEINSSTTRGSADKILAVGTETECKEILVIVSEGKRNCSFGAVTIKRDGSVVETPMTSKHPEICSEPPRPGEWLYEPYPAVMKLMNNFCPESGKVLKLDYDTNLYTSKDFQRDFPGTAFKIKETIEFNSKSIKEIRKKYENANVATRNFILSSPELVKKLKITEGGVMRIYGTRVKGRTMILVCEAEE